MPCLLQYLLQNFLQQSLQLLGHWVSFFFPPTSTPPCSIMVNQAPCWHVLPLYPSWLLLPVNSYRCMKSHTLDPYSWLIICNLKWAWPHARLMAIVALKLPWLHFNIFILSAINRMWLNYRVKHRQFCSWIPTSPQLAPKSLPITVKQCQNETLRSGGLAGWPDHKIRLFGLTRIIQELCVNFCHM